uniref:MGA conserved domain-containing protein n=1 Tax=Anopheles merus TaxID=30066 RepID=A0A182V2R0_ANOME
MILSNTYKPSPPCECPSCSCWLERKSSVLRADSAPPVYPLASVPRAKDADPKAYPCRLRICRLMYKPLPQGSCKSDLRQHRNRRLALVKKRAIRLVQTFAARRAIPHYFQKRIKQTLSAKQSASTHNGATDHAPSPADGSTDAAAGEVPANSNAITKESEEERRDISQVREEEPSSAAPQEPRIDRPSEESTALVRVTPKTSYTDRIDTLSTIKEYYSIQCAIRLLLAMLQERMEEVESMQKSKVVDAPEDGAPLDDGSPKPIENGVEGNGTSTEDDPAEREPLVKTEIDLSPNCSTEDADPNKENNVPLDGTLETMSPAAVVLNRVNSTPVKDEPRDDSRTYSFLETSKSDILDPTYTCDIELEPLEQRKNRSIVDSLLNKFNLSPPAKATVPSSFSDNSLDGSEGRRSLRDRTKIAARPRYIEIPEEPRKMRVSKVFGKLHKTLNLDLDCANSNSSTEFYGFDEGEIVKLDKPSLPGLLPTPIVKKSQPFAPFLAYGSSMDADSVETGEKTRSDLFREEGLISFGSLPPRLECPQRPNDMVRPRTVAQKRILVQRENDVRYLMIDNESKIFQFLKKRSKNIDAALDFYRMKELQDQQIPFTRDTWRALSWLRTEKGRYYFQTITIDNRTIKLSGCRGNHRYKTLSRNPLYSSPVVASRGHRIHYVSKCHCPPFPEGVKLNISEDRNKSSQSDAEERMMNDAARYLYRTTSNDTGYQNKRSYPGTKPGPLSSKCLQPSPDDDPTLGQLEVFKMPPVELEVFPKLNRPLDGFVKPYLKMILPHDGITENWARFAVSTLTADGAREEDKTVPSASEERSFVFELPYLNNQRRMLIRRRFMASPGSPVHCDVDEFRKLMDEKLTFRSAIDKALEEGKGDEIDPDELVCADVLGAITDSVAIALAEDILGKDDPEVDYVKREDGARPSREQMTKPIKIETPPSGGDVKPVPVKNEPPVSGEVGVDVKICTPPASAASEVGSGAEVTPAAEPSGSAPSSETGSKTVDPVKLKLLREMKRLNATIIEDPSDPAVSSAESTRQQKQQQQRCDPQYCSLGCICDVLHSSQPAAVAATDRRQHCRQSGCMFGCSCGFEEKLANQTQEVKGKGEATALTSADVKYLREKATARLAKEEREFTHTVILTKNTTVLVHNKETESRRQKKKPKKYDDYYNDLSMQSLLNGGSAKDVSQYISKPPPNAKPLSPADRMRHAHVLLTKLPQLADIEPLCMVHDLYRCFCDGKATQGQSASSARKSDPLAMRRSSVVHQKDDDVFKAPGQSQSTGADAQYTVVKPKRASGGINNLILKRIPTNASFAPMVHLPSASSKATTKKSTPPSKPKDQGTAEIPVKYMSVRKLKQLMLSEYKNSPDVKKTPDDTSSTEVRLAFINILLLDTEENIDNEPQLNILSDGSKKLVINGNRRSFIARRAFKDGMPPERTMPYRNRTTYIVQILSASNGSEDESTESEEPAVEKAQSCESVPQMKNEPTNDLDDIEPYPEPPKLSAYAQRVSKAATQHQNASSPIEQTDRQLCSLMRHINELLRRETLHINPAKKGIMHICRWNQLLNAFALAEIDVLDLTLTNGLEMTVIATAPFKQQLVPNVQHQISARRLTIDKMIAAERPSLLMKMVVCNVENVKTNELALVLYGNENFWHFCGFLKVDETCFKTDSNIPKAPSTIANSKIRTRLNDYQRKTVPATTAKTTTAQQSTKQATASKQTPSSSSSSSSSSSHIEPAPSTSMLSTQSNIEIVPKALQPVHFPLGLLPGIADTPDGGASDCRWMRIKIENDFSHMYLPSWQCCVTYGRIKKAIYDASRTAQAIRLDNPAPPNQPQKQQRPFMYALPKEGNALFLGPYKSSETKIDVILCQSVQGSLYEREVYERQNRIPMPANTKRTVGWWVDAVTSRVASVQGKIRQTAFNSLRPREAIKVPSGTVASTSCNTAQRSLLKRNNMPPATATVGPEKQARQSITAVEKDQMPSASVPNDLDDDVVVLDSDDNDEGENLGTAKESTENSSTANEQPRREFAVEQIGIDLFRLVEGTMKQNQQEKREIEKVLEQERVTKSVSGDQNRNEPNRKRQSSPLPPAANYAPAAKVIRITDAAGVERALPSGTLKSGSTTITRPINGVSTLTIAPLKSAESNVPVKVVPNALRVSRPSNAPPGVPVRALSTTKASLADELSGRQPVGVAGAPKQRPRLNSVAVERVSVQVSRPAPVVQESDDEDDVVWLDDDNESSNEKMKPPASASGNADRTAASSTSVTPAATTPVVVAGSNAINGVTAYAQKTILSQEQIAMIARRVDLTKTGQQDGYSFNPASGLLKMKRSLLNSIKNDAMLEEDGGVGNSVTPPGSAGTAGGLLNNLKYLSEAQEEKLLGEHPFTRGVLESKIPGLGLVEVVRFEREVIIHMKELTVKKQLVSVHNLEAAVTLLNQFIQRNTYAFRPYNLAIQWKFKERSLPLRPEERMTSVINQFCIVTVYGIINVSKQEQLESVESTLPALYEDLMRMKLAMQCYNKQLYEDEKCYENDDKIYDRAVGIITSVKAKSKWLQQQREHLMKQRRANQAKLRQLKEASGSAEGNDSSEKSAQDKSVTEQSAKDTSAKNAIAKNMTAKNAPTKNVPARNATARNSTARNSIARNSTAKNTPATDVSGSKGGQESVIVIDDD